MFIKCLKTGEEFQALKGEWNQLLYKSRSNNIFLTWEWLYTWWEIFKDRDKELMIITIRDGDNELLCIAPFIRNRVRHLGFIPAHQIRFLATGEDERDEICSDYLDIIVREGEKEDQLLQLLFEFLLKMNEWDEILLENLREDSVAFRFLNNLKGNNLKKLVDQKGQGLYLELTHKWSDLMMSLSNTQRYKIKRTLRELEGLGQLRFEIVMDEEGLDKTFKDLTELHQKRWRKKGKPGVFSSHKFTSFHSAITKSLLHNGCLMMANLIINNRPLGVLYNICYNGSVLFYQSGIDTTLSRDNQWIKPGLALHALAIKRAIELGCREYDFLPGETGSYKGQWTPKMRNIYNIGLRRKDLKTNTLSALRYTKGLLKTFYRKGQGIFT